MEDKRIYKIEAMKSENRKEEEENNRDRKELIDIERPIKKEKRIK